MATLPLSGVRVLSLAEQYPGPYATMLLADLGADVILVERPDGGDPARRFPGLFAAFNRNKRAVALDLKSEQGRADFLELVDGSDVVLEGFRPGVMKRLKLDAETLRARKPSLIFVSISSAGQDGPGAGIAGHDLSIQAGAGMVEVPYGSEAGLSLPVLPLADISSAMFAALGVVTALYSRTNSGNGSTIDISMLESLVSWMTPFLVPPMNGLPIRRLPPGEPCYGVYATADAGKQVTLSIAGEDHMWKTLCATLELEQYASLNEEQRIARAAEIEPHVRAAIGRWRFDALCARLEADRVAFGPVLSVNEVVNDPHMLARGMITSITEAGSKLGDQNDASGAVQATRFIRQPLLIDGELGSIERPPPGLGQHNAELLGHK